MMTIFRWLLFGLIVGVVVKIFDGEHAKGGFLETLFVGMAGSVFGGLSGELLFGIGISGFNFSSFAVAILGSLIILILGRVFRRSLF